MNVKLNALNTLLSFCLLIIFISCGEKKKEIQADSPKTTRVRGVISYKRAFGDLNEVHLSSATVKGIVPLENREQADSLKTQLLRIRGNEYYTTDSLTHSIPYLVPSASVLLTKIGSNFQDSLKNKGLAQNKIIVTSILRTKDDVRRLRRRNGNASLNSAHFYGTTFDVSYRRFCPVETGDSINPDKLKMVLAEVLRDLREKEWCYVKYELKQGCFHITTRL